MPQNNTTGANNNLEKIKTMLAKVTEMSDDEYRAWLKQICLFHNYSINNRILIWLAGGSQVMGQQQWKRMGRELNNGQWNWPIWILAPTIIKKKVQVEQPDGTTMEEEKSIMIGFKCVKVYDIAQTHGKNLPDVYTVKSAVPYATMKNLATELGFSVEEEPMEHLCGGHIKADGSGQIRINANHSDAEKAGSLLHEVAHGLLRHHVEELRVELELTREMIECEAETLTYLLGDICGIEKQSAFYLKGWGLKEEIFKSFLRIDKAFNIFKKKFAEVTGEKKEAVA